MDHSWPLELFLVERLRVVKPVALVAGSFQDKESDDSDSNKGEENANDTANDGTRSRCTGWGVS